MADDRPRPLAGLVRLLRPFSIGEARTVAGAAGLGLAAVALQVARPWPLKWLVEGMGSEGVASPVALALAFVALTALGAAATRLHRLRLAEVASRMVRRLRERLVGDLVRRPLAFHDRHEPGELTARVVNDTARLRRGLNALFGTIVQPVALLLASATVLLLLDPRLGVVLVAGAAAALLLMWRFGVRITAEARRRRRKEGRLSARTSRQFESMRELKAAGLDDQRQGTSAGFGDEGEMVSELRLRRLSLGLVAWVDVAIAVGIAAAIWVASQVPVPGSLPVGDLVLLLAYSLALRDPFVEFARTTSHLGRTVACGERLSRLLESGSDAVAPAPTSADAPLRGAVRFERVSVRTSKRRRGARKWVLRDIDLEIPFGQLVAITGPSGAGKSTLLQLVLGLIVPTDGRMLWDARELNSYAPDAVRRRVSAVLQGSALPGATIHEAIALGVTDAPRPAVEAAAASAGIAEFVAQLPRGYDTAIPRGGDLFSTGERQRLAIARAIFRDGAIWLLDDPTAGLDPASSAAVTTLLLERTSGRTVLWVTGDPLVQARADMRVALDAGRLHTQFGA